MISTSQEDDIEEDFDEELVEVDSEDVELSDEEFEKLVLEAVWVSFVRFKLACEFNEWDDIFIEE